MSSKIRANLARSNLETCPKRPEVKVISTLSVVKHSTILLFTLIQFYLFQACQSTLLTDVYSKKLSKLSDFPQNNYLVLQGGLFIPAGPVQSPRDSLQSSTSLQSKSRLNNGEEDEDSNFESSQISPLVTAWQQSIGENGGGSAKLASNGGTSANSNQNRINNTDIVDLIDYSKIAGEPNVVESVPTEFPNPNINSLGHEITKILKKFFLHGYDKRVRPNYSGPPALVNVSFHIIGISSVDEVQMDFTTDFYFRQKWFDPRLEFNPVGNIDELCVGAEFAEKIWLPDTFFANEKTATFHRATTENTFIRIAHTGRVYRSIRLTVTCSCPMDLQYFPMDRQRCKIEIESYGYNTRDIDYRWERGDASVTLNTKIELPQFKILGFKMGQEIQNLSSGDYIRLYCEIHFVRSMGYYLIQIYIPASLIVMISWVSFWLHRNATPARVALGVTTVLTMTTLMSSTNAALPKISYIKSIDVFLGTCFVMVFASLLEYASVGYIGKRIAMKRKRLQDLQQMQKHHQRICVAAAASAAAFNNQQQSNRYQFQQQLQPPPTITNYSNNEDSLIVLQLQQTPSHDNRINDQRSLNSNSYDHSQTINQRMVSGDRDLDRHRDRDRDRNRNLNLSRNCDDQDYCLQVVRDLESNDQDSPKSDITIGGNTTTNATNTITNTTTTANVNKNCSTTIDRKDKSRSKKMKLDPINLTDYLKTPLLNQNIPPTSNAPLTTFTQPSHGATTEFDATTTHDMIRICGITPSAIDKHSRVVFPICFVCFNLMYWIIYGHISQQVEDRGPPMIPFIKGQ